MLKSRVHLASTGRAANIRVGVHGANNVFTHDGIDWPVSGDETRLRHGYAGSGIAPRLWSAIGRYGVNAERARITIGSVIVTNDGSRLTVTRRGSIAGFGTDAAGVLSTSMISQSSHRRSRPAA